MVEWIILIKRGDSDIKKLYTVTHATLLAKVKQLSEHGSGAVTAIDTQGVRFIMRYDHTTYICRPFAKGETVTLILPDESIFNEHQPRPLIIADNDFPADIFDGCRSENLQAFREFSAEGQKAVIDRNISARYSIKKKDSGSSVRKGLAFPGSSGTPNAIVRTEGRKTRSFVWRDCITAGGWSGCSPPKMTAKHTEQLC